MQLSRRAERICFKHICSEYHGLVSWRLKDHEEPQMPFPMFNPNARIEPEELVADAAQRKSDRVEVPNSCIRHWLKYRAGGLRKQGKTSTDPRKDPWAVLLAKLSGVTCPPKARQAYQQLMHEAYAEKIAPEVATRWKEKQSIGSSVPTTEPTAVFHAEVSHAVFASLSKEEQTAYAERAKVTVATAREEYQTFLHEKPSTKPEDRQNCIDHIGTFMAPILQGIHERTGLHSVILMVGPIPKYEGDVRTVHVSFGKTKSAAGDHFLSWASERFNAIVEVMKEYGQAAFSGDDCKTAALPSKGEAKADAKIASTSATAPVNNPLKAARYKISDDSDDNSGSDGSDDSEGTGSASDSDNLSGSESEAEAEVPARKKRKGRADPLEGYECRREGTGGPHHEAAGGVGTIEGSHQRGDGFVAEVAGEAAEGGKEGGDEEEGGAPTRDMQVESAAARPRPRLATPLTSPPAAPPSTETPMTQRPTDATASARGDAAATASPRHRGDAPTASSGHAGRTNAAAASCHTRDALAASPGHSCDAPPASPRHSCNSPPASP
ncbi:hypothetical protein C8J57DRAFT_1529762 [Mycena rebaudengoi]|nr:hypothetical protein C8J57DRAFT_1529762 [Mycena rebaudengoi]